LYEYFKLLESYPEDKRFTYIIDDNKYESAQTGIVDLAFGLGCEFINIQGIYKIEKLAKVIRFAEIIDSLTQME
jgi:enolase